jgi:hypothetical protein
MLRQNKVMFNEMKNVGKYLVENILVENFILSRFPGLIFRTSRNFLIRIYPVIKILSQSELKYVTKWVSILELVRSRFNMAQNL